MGTPVEISNWGTKGVQGASSFPVKEYRGAADDKPSEGVTPGSTYFAWDSSKFYMYDGTQWNELFAAADNSGD